MDDLATSPFKMWTFGPAPLLLEATDLVLTSSKRINHIFVDRTGMPMTDCPIEAPLNMRRINMVWHARLRDHPAQSWLQNLLREVEAGRLHEIIQAVPA